MFKYVERVGWCMDAESDSECVSVHSAVEVCVGDEFRVVNERSSLLGMADAGEEFEVRLIEVTPSGPEVVVEYKGDGREYWFSPTTLGEALGIAEYPSAPDEPCLERIE